MKKTHFQDYLNYTSVNAAYSDFINKQEEDGRLNQLVDCITFSLENFFLKSYTKIQTEYITSFWQSGSYEVKSEGKFKTLVVTEIISAIQKSDKLHSRY